MALGVTVTTRTSPPAGGAIPTATDAWFVAGVTDVGTLSEPVEIRDMATFDSAFGPRTAGNIELWDALDFFFREGGRRAIVVRAASGNLATALSGMVDDLGPGQVSAIGFPQISATYSALLAHAQAHNRFAICDATDTDDVSSLETLAATFVDTGGYGALFGPWLNGAGPSGVTGVTTRSVPPSPVIAALCARVDATGNPNQAAAGRAVPMQYVTDIRGAFTASDRELLLNAGLNTSADIFGVLENYGFQTAIDQSVNSPFWQANCCRMRMALVAQARAIGENYMFKTMDGQGLLANDLKGHLEAMLLDYFNLGALYGATAAQAFKVDVGANTNTIESIAQGRLRAIAQVVLSLHAKSVEIELVTIPVGGQVV